MSDTASYNMEDELVKIKNALAALWAKVPHSTEVEANEVAGIIDSIGPQPVAEDTPAADTANDPLAGLSDADLEAEIAKRQAEAQAQ